EVKQGEVLGIIGRNGAGKSTLLKILSKVTAPTTGNIKIKGRVASLLEVGTGFHPDLSGRDNIFLNGAILGMMKKEIQNKFDEIVDFAGVERYIDTPVKRYSSGMYVRLAFAVAAHLEPEILIVDEVLAVGDAEFQKKCLGKMKDVSEKDGRTVLFVSHNMPAVQKLCTNAMVMQFGKNIYTGNTDDAVDHYLHNRKSNDTEEDLAMRSDRGGNGLLRCTAVKLLNRQLQEVISFKSGDELNIALDYTIKAEQIHAAWFRIQVVSADEEILFICNNAHSKDVITIDASGRVICSIPRLPLFGGTYYINIYIKSLEGVLDDVEFARELHVVDGDFFGTGKIPGIRKGMFVMHNWTLPGSSATTE
ncbi:MAG: ABC transporter ATP-binding protein, partial [Panacibacter sp.]